MKKKPEGILPRVNALKIGDSSADIYNDWAGFYEDDLIDKYGYLSPEIASNKFSELLADKSVDVIDYGCGTGLVGKAMHERGYSNIDGIDISEGMLAQARQKNVYRQLYTGDLTMRARFNDNRYDGGLCVGSMGAGHIDASHVPELLRPIKKNGLFVIYMNDMHYESEGFDRQFHVLEVEGIWKISCQEKSNYMSELDRPGWLIAAYKC